MATVNIFDMADTWNNVATTYTAIKMNVTDTASNASSLLLDLQVGTLAAFNVQKNGITRIWQVGTSSLPFCEIGGSNQLRLRDAATLAWTTGGAGGTVDLHVKRRGAANLQLGSSDAASHVAQNLSVQSVVAGTTNTAGANFTIAGSQGTGTGAGGSIIFQVAPAGSTSSTAQNALSTALTIDSTRKATFGGRVETEMVGSSVSSNFSGILFSGAVHSHYIASGIQLEVRQNQCSIGGQLGTGATLSADAANTLALRTGTNAQAPP